MNFILNLLFNIQSTYSRGPQGVPLIGVLEMQINMRSVFKSWFLKIFGFKENCKTHTIYSSNANLNQRVNFCSDSISSQGQTTTTFLYLVKLDLIKLVFVFVFNVFARAFTELLLRQENVNVKDKNKNLLE